MRGTAASFRMPLCLFVMTAAVALLSGRPLGAVEQTTERITEVAAIEQRIGRVRLRGSGSLSGNVQRLRGGVQVRGLFKSPLFLATESRFDQEKRLPYDLRLGWVENFGDTDDVPFFERYFVGGTNTVRGHRSRWLTPRGLA